MLIQAMLGVLITAVNTLFSWLPLVDKLPTIGGVDVDSALVNGVGLTYNFSAYVWPVRDVLIGFGFLIGYYAVKLTLKIFLGSRAPGSHA